MKYTGAGPACGPTLELPLSSWPAVVRCFDRRNRLIGETDMTPDLPDGIPGDPTVSFHLCFGLDFRPAWLDVELSNGERLRVVSSIARIDEQLRIWALVFVLAAACVASTARLDVAETTTSVLFVLLGFLAGVACERLQALVRLRHEVRKGNGHGWLL